MGKGIINKYGRVYSLLIALLLLTSYQSVFSQGTLMPIGPQSNTFSSMVRGYYFTAPASFTICGLYIPTTASTGAQNVEVVRFTAGPPPAYPATTNNFVSLFYLPNHAPNAIIPCNIQVNAGDVIGIYGARGAGMVNSYDGVQYASNILGFPVTLFRSGMQANLSTQQMANIWNENNYNIGRIEMYYNCCSTPVYSNANATICQNDSILLGGAYQNTPGNYNDTLFGAAVGGCDSIITTTLTVNPVSTTNTNAQICQGDSILVGGAYQTTSGNYNDTLYGGAANGCDSIITTNLNVYPVPVNNVNTSICQGDSILLAGVYQKNSGIYNDTIYNGSSHGCDSVVSTNLTVIPIPIGNANARVCDGDSILIGSSYYSTAGVYPYTIPNGSASGCDSIVNVNLTIDYAFSNHQDLTICQGDSVLVGGQYVSKFGYNEVKYQSINGCDSVYTATIAFRPQFDYTLPDDTILCLGKYLTLQPPINYNYYSLMWENGSTSPEREIDTAGTYVMTYQHHICNHQGTDEINVLFENCDFYIYVPNTFTPDKDGLNEGFAPVIYGEFTDYSFRIFNRWGELLFESNTHGESWKGTYLNEAVKSDVYVWQLEVKPKKGKLTIQTGKVTILK